MYIMSSSEPGTASGDHHGDSPVLSCLTESGPGPTESGPIRRFVRIHRDGTLACRWLAVPPPRQEDVPGRIGRIADPFQACRWTKVTKTRLGASAVIGRGSHDTLFCCH